MYFVILLLIKLCYGWKLPAVKFLSEFAEENDRTKLSLLVPDGIPLMNRYFRQLTRSVYTIIHDLKNQLKLNFAE